jgi:hypothetical protein
LRSRFLSTVRAATLAHREFDAGADRTILPDGGESFFLRYLPDGFGPEAREAAILEAATRAVDSSWAALDVAIKEKYEVAEDHLEDVSDLQSWRKSAEHAAILDFQSALRTREVSLDLWASGNPAASQRWDEANDRSDDSDEMSDAEAAELVAHLTRIAELAHRRGGGSGLYLDRLEASADVPIRDGRTSMTRTIQLCLKARVPTDSRQSMDEVRKTIARLTTDLRPIEYSLEFSAETPSTSLCPTNGSKNW